jgi:hypothetical protein
LEHKFQSSDSLGYTHNIMHALPRTLLSQSVLLHLVVIASVPDRDFSSEGLKSLLNAAKGFSSVPSLPMQLSQQMRGSRGHHETAN